MIGLRSRCLHHSYFKIKNQSSSLILKKELLKTYNKIMTSNALSLKKIYLDLIKNNNSFFCKKKFLSLENLSNISKNNLITLASHSMSHVPLSDLPEVWLKWEIEESKKYIKKLKGNVSIFSYPYGHINSYNEKVKKLLFSQNIKYAFTTRAFLLDNNSNKLELGRTFLFNNKNKKYILGSSFGAMKLFDSFLKR